MMVKLVSLCAYSDDNQHILIYKSILSYMDLHWHTSASPAAQAGTDRESGPGQVFVLLKNIVLQGY